MIKKKCFENNWIISKYKKIKLDRKYLDKIKDVDLPDDLNILNKLKSNFSRELLLMGDSY